MKRFYEIVTDYLHEFVASNPGGTKLPSEAQLCMKFKASRATIRHALGNMVEKGYIYSYQGKGYFVNRNSQNEPAFRQKEMVMFIYPDQITSFPLKILKGLSDFFDANNMLVLNFPTYNISEKEDYYIGLAEKIGCKGLVIMPVDKDIYTNVQLSLILKDFPVIVVDRKLFGLDIACISSDHYKMTYEATTYLLNRKKNVMFIANYKSSTSSSARINGYTDALMHNSVSPPLLYDSLNFSDLAEGDDRCKIEKFAAYLRENNVSGVVCNSGLYTDFTIKAFKHLGKSLNEDYELVVLDSDSDNLDGMVGQINYIHQDAYKIGEIAGKELLDKIKSNIKPQSHIVPFVSVLK